MSSDDEIRFDRAGIANLLQTGLYQVPRYQREFKWEGDHVHELFQDIENAIALPGAFSTGRTDTGIVGEGMGHR